MAAELYSCPVATYFHDSHGACHTVLNILHNAQAAVCGIFHCQMLAEIILQIRCLTNFSSCVLFSLSGKNTAF